MIPWRIPRMTDPLRHYWTQPVNLRDRVELYETHATIRERDWLALPRYDHSVPSGVYAGKVWRWRKYICWFGRDLGGGEHTIGRLRALVQYNDPSERIGA